MSSNTFVWYTHLAPTQSIYAASTYIYPRNAAICITYVGPRMLHRTVIGLVFAENIGLCSSWISAFCQTPSVLLLLAFSLPRKNLKCCTMVLGIRLPAPVEGTLYASVNSTCPMMTCHQGWSQCSTCFTSAGRVEIIYLVFSHISLSTYGSDFFFIFWSLIW